MNAPASHRRLTTTLRPEEFPPIYAMQCDGACMEPVFRDGSKLNFSRDEPYQVGDYVAVIPAPGVRSARRPPDHHQATRSEPRTRLLAAGLA